MKKIKRLFAALKNLLKFPDAFHSSLNYVISNTASKQDIEDLKIQNGKIWCEINKANTVQILENIQVAEFKVFSQWGDDGIIQFLVNYLSITEHTFIEFGVENYKEANTRFLLINNNWKGLIIDGADLNINQVKNEHLYWKHDITALSFFITKENINSIFESNGFKGEIGLLHIDIDGNDYWIWEEINVVLPVIVIIEYNSLLGNEKPLTINYDAGFYRTNAHFSNLYYGASLPALCDLSDAKGYYFIGCNSNGNNAYFIRKDRISGLRPLTAAQGFVASKFREGRDESGGLTYSSGSKRYKAIEGTKMYNTRTKQTETL